MIDLFIISNLFEFMYCSIDIALLYYYCSVFIKNRSKVNAYYISIISTVLLFIITSSTIYSGSSTTLSLILMIFYSFIVFTGKFINRLIIPIFYFVISGLVTLLITSIIPVFTTISIIELFNGSPLRIIVALIIRILTYLLASIANKLIYKQKEMIISRNLLMYLVAFFLVLIFFFEIFFLEKIIYIDVLIFVMSMVFILFFIIIFFLIVKYYEKKEKIIEIQMLLKEANIKNENYIISANNQLEILKLKHDLSNHLISLKQLISKNENIEAEKYIDKIKIHPALKQYVNSKNELFNAILNTKISENLKIKFNIRYDDVVFNISPNILTIILGNALDNAIEAVNHLEIEKRIVNIIISENYQFIKIYISNSLKFQPIVKDGEFISLKRSNRIGIGMKNIIEAVKECNGTLKYNYDLEHFELIILLSKPSD